MANRRNLLFLTILLGCNKPDPRVAEARHELDSFAKSVGEYRDQKGRWPPNLMEAVGSTCIGGRSDCVSDKGKRVDPWGSPYEYDQSLRSALVRSPGPDKRFGTRDDLETSVPASEPAKPSAAPNPGAAGPPTPAPPR